MSTTDTRTGAALIVVLATLTGLAPLATDMYVPGLPELTRALDTHPSTAQLSMTAFLVGVMIGQLVLGPVSDAVGRRPVLVAGAGLFTVCSVVCAVAPSAEVLNVARLLQGITGAAGIVVSRAVITDLVDGVAAARKFSALAAITSAAPILAPMLGGAVLNVASWRAVFAVLAVIGVLQVIGVLVWVPESLPLSRRASAKPGPALAAMAHLAKRRTLLRHVLSLCFGGAAVFAYIAGSTFVFQDVYGASATLTSVIYGVNAVGTMAGSVLFGRVVDRFGVARLLVTGIATALGAAVVLAVLLVTTSGSLAVVWICLFTMIAAFGVFFPAVTTAAQEAGRDAPGATSALLGGGQFLLGGAISPLVGAFGITSALPMTLVIVGCLGAATLTASYPGRGP